MRFKAFFRYETTKGSVPAGAPNPAVNTDNPPSPLASGTTKPVYPAVQPAANEDNLLVVQNFTSQAGFPQKIAVGYGFVGTGAAPAATATLYVLEEATGLWYVVGTAATALAAGGLVFFDALPVPDYVPFDGTSPGANPALAANTWKSPNGRYLLVPVVASPTTGQYYFAMAPVMTANP